MVAPGSGRKYYYHEILKYRYNLELLGVRGLVCFKFQPQKDNTPY
jgi:hypothetical protein